MQCSIRHTRLTLITQRVGDSLLRDRPRMLWLPSFFKVWGKRGMHGTFHQFQQYLLRSLSADDAAHRVAWGLAILHSTKESVKGFVEPLEHILLHLAMNILVLFSHLFDGRQLISLHAIGDRHATQLIGLFAFLQGGIIQLFAPAQGPFQGADLLVGGIQAKLVRLASHIGVLRLLGHGLRCSFWLFLRCSPMAVRISP